MLTRALELVSDAFEVHQIGIGYKGPIRREAGVTLHPCNAGGGDVYGAHQLRSFATELRPNLVFLLNDLWLLRVYEPVLRELRGTAKVVTYFPLDGTIWNDEAVDVLEYVDAAVVYTPGAADELRRSVARRRVTRPALKPPVIEVIPHGVDRASFYPLDAEQRRAARKTLFPAGSDWRDGFVVLNANRPQPRKRIDITIRGFSEFARGKPAAVKLYLHHALTSVAEHHALAGLIRECGIETRVSLSSPRDDPFPDRRLNQLYNASDVGINTSLGEGWGLVSFEHGATRAAQIVPRHSACGELWNGAAECVEPSAAARLPALPLEMASVDPCDVAAALERLYSDPNHRMRLAQAAFERASRPEYDWSFVGEQWRDLFTRARDMS